MKKFVVFIICAILSGCCSTNPNFYQPISIVSNDINFPKLKNTILINQVFLPSNISRLQITTLGKNDFDVNIDEFNRWSSQPEKMLQNVINENLSKLLPNAIIENQTPFIKNYDYAVMIEFTKLEGRLDDIVHINSSYFIKNKLGKTIKSGKFNASKKFEGGYDRYVEELSTLIGDLSIDIAKKLTN